jgi:alpha-mannosidase
VSLEEEGGGIALLNDCKYGHDAEGGRVRLTLLRSPTAPDPEADMGFHRFTYALLPFTGTFGESGIVRAGYELNDPARAEAISAADKTSMETRVSNDYSLFWIEGESIIAETIKVAEPNNENGNKKRIVIRLYESLGGNAKTVLHFNKALATAAETDMLEENPSPLFATEEDLFLEFKAFEIKTVMVTFA